jgi:hypothetical protein
VGPLVALVQKPLDASVLAAAADVLGHLALDEAGRPLLLRDGVVPPLVQVSASHGVVLVWLQKVVPPLVQVQVRARGANMSNMSGVAVVRQQHGRARAGEGGLHTGQPGAARGLRPSAGAGGRGAARGAGGRLSSTHCTATH